MARRMADSVCEPLFLLCPSIQQFSASRLMLYLHHAGTDADMLTSYQKHWGIAQWVTFLKDKEVPVLPSSRDALLSLDKEAIDALQPRQLAHLVLDDPFLTLRLLRRAESKRSRHLAHDTTTPLAAVLQAGVDDVIRIVHGSELFGGEHPGLMACATRAVLASRIGRSWASYHADISPEEIALAALLAEIGELMLWHFAPELPQTALDELHSGHAQRTLQAQQQTCGFAFRQLTLTMIEAWELPVLIAQLIKGSDNIRANIARISVDTARHVEADHENPAIPSDLVSAREFIPAATYRNLIAVLPLSEEYRSAVLNGLEANPLEPHRAVNSSSDPLHSGHAE